MSFVRSFSQDKICKMKKDSLYTEKLSCDVEKGEVFPALRNEELHFYYGGGCLFKFSGASFKRNKAYKKYGEEVNEDEDGYVTQDTYGKNFLECYEELKEENRKRFAKEENCTQEGDGAQERQFLKEYYAKTYCGTDFPPVCVLDIEVRINNDGNSEKCDMVLFNSVKNEIMFVECKIFGDYLRKCSSEGPMVISQVKEYTDQIEADCKNIEKQYCEYLSIMSQIFFEKAWEKKAPKLIIPAKLVVFETPSDQDVYKKLNSKLEEKNIKTLWIEKCKHKNYSIEDIWLGVKKDIP